MSAACLFRTAFIRYLSSQNAPPYIYCYKLLGNNPSSLKKKRTSLKSLRPYQTTMMELFPKIVKGQKPRIIFVRKLHHGCLIVLNTLPTGAWL